MTNTHTNESGRSMIEMLGVLAIIGVLSVGGIAGYSQAMSKFKVSKTTDQIQTMVTNIRTLFAGNRTYNGLKGTGDGANYKNAHTLGIFNDEICESADCASPVNPYGGSIILASPNSDQYFSITYTGLPQDACTRLVMADWGDASSGLIAIKASGKEEAAPSAAADWTETANSVYTTKKGTIPVSLTNAIGACTNGATTDNTSSISWIYR